MLGYAAVTNLQNLSGLKIMSHIPCRSARRLFSEIRLSEQLASQMVLITNARRSLRPWRVSYWQEMSLWTTQLWVKLITWHHPASGAKEVQSQHMHRVGETGNILWISCEHTAVDAQEAPLKPDQWRQTWLEGKGIRSLNICRLRVEGAGAGALFYI